MISFVLGFDILLELDWVVGGGGFILVAGCLWNL
jgi:hypothetical protein